MSIPTTGSSSSWLLAAILSGACAAFNGVFAKLYALTYAPRSYTNGVESTTTDLTASWANRLAALFSLNPKNRVVELAIRAVCHFNPVLCIVSIISCASQLFLGLNIVFNGIMWGLFTRALTLSTSTVRVSIINTSANFFITAVLGALIFSESLPAMWWLGAAFLMTGSVIIGMREEKDGIVGTDSLPENDGKVQGKNEEVREKKTR